MQNVFYDFILMGYLEDIPRLKRLDSAGVLRHVMGPGIERKHMFNELGYPGAEIAGRLALQIPA